MAVSPEGGSAYVTNFDGDDVSQYDVGAGGALTPKSPPTVAAGGGPFGVAVTPDGTSVYVTNFDSGTVSQYDVAAGGTLAPKSPPTVASNGAPRGVAITPLPGLPTGKDQCKNGGYKQFGFKNQGQCIASVEPGPKPQS